MPGGKLFFLRISTIVCNHLAYITAGIHYCMMSVGFLKVPVYVLNTPGRKYKNLHNIWYAKILRRMISVLVRSPLRSNTLQLVNFTIPLPTNSGCIIATCDTPWKRLLVQWCIENDFLFFISFGKLTSSNKLIQRQGAGFRDLREIVKYLRLNGRIILRADVFNGLNNCPVQFLGNYHNATLLPARLAKLAGVPLIVTVPILHKGIINFIQGPQFDLNILRYSSYNVTQNTISFLENEIKKNSSIWLSYVKS